jgi:hypothetical protein
MGVLLKLLGLLLIGFGVFCIRYFPDITIYQRVGMTRSGILIGFISFFIGIALLIWG